VQTGKYEINPWLIVFSEPAFSPAGIVERRFVRLFVHSAVDANYRRSYSLGCGTVAKPYETGNFTFPDGGERFENAADT
jgi:hypothetical protein